MKDASKIVVAETPVLLPLEPSECPCPGIGIDLFPRLSDTGYEIAELKSIKWLPVEGIDEDIFSPSDVAVSRGGMPLEYSSSTSACQSK